VCVSGLTKRGRENERGLMQLRAKLTVRMKSVQCQESRRKRKQKESERAERSIQE